MVIFEKSNYYNEHDIAFNTICDLRREDKSFNYKYPYFIEKLYETIYSPNIYSQTFHGQGD